MAQPQYVLPRTTARAWVLTAGMIQIPLGFTKLFKDRDKIPGKTLCPIHAEPHPLKQAYICNSGDTPVMVDKPLSGYEYEKGSYVILDEDEKAALPQDHDGIIELIACIDSSDVEGDLFEGTFLAMPQKTPIAVSNYAVVLKFLSECNKALVGKGTWWGSTRSFVFEARANGYLVVHVCNYIENLKAAEIEQVIGLALPEVPEASVKMAELGFSTLPSVVDWTEVTDTQSARQRSVIMEKVETGKVTVSETPTPIEDVPDILAALREQVAHHNELAAIEAEQYDVDAIEEEAHRHVA